MFRSSMPLTIALVISCMTSLGAYAQGQQRAPAPTPFPSMFEGTPQEQAACAPDSQRFCKELEPNALLVLGCLQRNRTQIAPACRKVLESHGQ